ncbi:hypothetical protein [uncultured Polaribacter sp.]|uniref:hypothetical protein n=1 Tax=uncultured Polaribacter sp. TaxID=174711 RepID=UPI002636208D|nr:hypothetical protein [uncultured Polaribacter sp.]
MKKLIIFISVTLIFVANINAQKELDSLNFKNTQDINFFKTIKNRTLVKKYTTESGNIIKIGDTIVLGAPTSMEMSTKTLSGSYGRTARGGVSKSRSTTKKTYEFIKMGRPAGFGSIMSSLNGDDAAMASNSLKNSIAVVTEIKAYHRGSKKKPLYLVMVLGEVNGRAFGINKYLSVMDTELALESGEVLLKNRKKTRAEAIQELKEAKELLEIDIMTKEEFELLKKELGPIIRAKKS